MEHGPHAVAARLPSHGERRAVGLRGELGARWWSYAELHRRACGFAGTLRETGVEPGGRVLVWAGDGPEWAAVALGAMLRGVAVVPVDRAASVDHVRRLAAAVRPGALVHGAAQDAAGVDVRPVPLADAAGRHGDPAEAGLVAARQSDPAFVLYTSGTTGEPRGVVLTHANLASQVAAFQGWRRLTRRVPFRLLALSPLSHSQGLLMGLFVPLSLGLSVLYSESVEAPHVIRTIRQNRVTLLLAVPRVQQQLARALQEGRYRGRDETVAEHVRGLRSFPVRRHVLFLATHARLGYSFWVLLVGGAVLPAEDERFWYESGFVLVQGYGLTETSALVSVNVNWPFGARLGSIGRALPHQELRLAADGEVLVRGPNVSPGDLNGDLGGGPDGTAAADGFLRTGDLASADRRDRLHFRGRKNDLIVTSEGMNVHAADVEAVLGRVPGVRDAVVTAPPGWSAGRSEVHAVLLLAPGTEAAAAVREANRGLEAHQRIHSWSVWPEPDFPRTALLKVRRADVVGAVSAPPGADRVTGAAEAGLPPLDAIRATGDRRRRLDLLARHVAASPAAEPADPASVIEEFGLSSLDTVELVGLIERYAGRPLERLTVTPRTTLAELRDMVRTGAAPAVRSRLPAGQPRWSAGVPGELLRRVTRPVLAGSWARLSARVAVETDPGAADPPDPCIVVAAPHRHWLDGFAVQAALPRGRRTVTVTNRDFAEHFAPAPGTPRRERLAVGLAYHLLWPLVFSFVILPRFGGTRDGLQELGRLVDRGLSPIAFPKGLAPPGEAGPRHEPGIALMAVQTGLPVVPVWLAGNDALRVRPRRGAARVVVRVGAPIPVGPATRVPELVARIEAAFDGLAAATAVAP